MGLSDGCTVPPPSFPSSPPASSCRLSSTGPQEAGALSPAGTAEETLCGSVGTSRCPNALSAHSLPACKLPKGVASSFQPTAFSLELGPMVLSFSQAGNQQVALLPNCQVTQASFLISLGLCRMETIMAALPTPWG